MSELAQIDSELSLALENINGKNLEKRINQLSEIGEGGRIGEGGSRLAFSPKEKDARKQIELWMGEAGMVVEEHPWGIVGLYQGKNIALPAIGCGSHIDTVPRAGRYDGTFGVVASIEAVRAMNEMGIKPKRSIMVFAFTCEESSAFSLAKAGSKAAFVGLSDKELGMSRKGEIPMREAIKEMGFDSETMKSSSISADRLAFFIEPHIEQDKKLDENGLEIGVVTAIASPDRRTVIIGDSLESKVSLGVQAEGIKVVVQGKGGHSGATPMGRESRADGLRPTADLLMVLPAAFEKMFREKGVQILIGGVRVEGQALNKIPGRTEMEIVFSGDSRESVEEAKKFVTNYLQQLNVRYAKNFSEFGQNPIQFEDLSQEQVNGKKYLNPEQVLPYFHTSGKIVAEVDRICSKYKDQNIVGTIGTFDVDDDGIIYLGLDVRGINEALRNKVMEEITVKIVSFGQEELRPVSIKINSISSESPTEMDPELVEIIAESASSSGLEKIVKMISPAGHDIQNVPVKKGMIFIPSRNGGVSHVPEEYSTPEDLRNGTKVLLNTIYNLAMKIA